VYKRALIPLDASSMAERILPFLVKIAGPLALEVVLGRDAAHRAARDRGNHVLQGR
jgi:hypothetical protein